MSYNPTYVWNGEVSHVTYAAESADFDFSTTFTLECWFKAETWPTLSGLIGKWTTSGDNRSWVFRLYNDSGDVKAQIVCDSNGSAGGADVHTSSILTSSSDKEWNHYAVSVDAGTSTFVFNGTSSGGSTGLDDPYNSNSNTVIGAERSDGTDGADGSFGLVRVWDGVARSVAEINDNKCVKLGSTTGLSAEWDLDNVYTDNSGNSHTLTNSGGAFETDSGPAVCAVSAAANNAIFFGGGM